MGLRSLPRQSGIYSIKCTNGAVYIGQSVDIAKRCRLHWASLVKGSHYNKRLQRCFNKYGADSLCFAVEELCGKEILNTKEQEWIDRQDLSMLLNCAPVAVSPGGVKRSRETIEKRLQKMQGYRHSEETKAKMRAAQQANADAARARAILQMQDPEARVKAGNGRRGKSLTDEHKALVSKTSLERWSDQEYKARMSEVQRKAQAKMSAKNSEQMKLKWQDPAYRAYMAACKAAKKLQRINREVSV